jgi:hypothetical protein
MRLWTILLLSFAIGCKEKDKDTGDTDTDTDTDVPVDIDGDGYTADDGDCDDGDASVYPGADEVWYDGVDQDCDGNSDYDRDGDGVDQGDDCNDEDAAISPNADELCDGVDNDCNGETDESGEYTAYLDADGDGFGTGDPLGTYCELPAGTASNAEDCNDTDPAVSPLAEELCDGVDNNCDTEVDVGVVDGIAAYADADLDGYGDDTTATNVCELSEGWVDVGGDCDDADLATFPGAEEVCDLKDNNCDGAVDEGATEGRTYYADTDSDGYGDPAVTTVECGAPAGFVEDGTDCDDTDAARSPGASEVCDGIDNDCDAEIDADAVDGTTLYADADADGYGDDATMVVVCEVVDGWVDVGGDCDDTSASASPGVDELCDGLDNNCDGTTDESTATDAATWYIDADGDGHGDASAAAPACDQPAGFSASDDDCNDLDATVYPSAPELCDELDNDCDGSVDNGASDASMWYADNDADGYGDASMTEASCEQPVGYVSDDTDCDDTSVSTYPGADETCDGLDQDCDGTADNDPTDGVTLYADADADGYGDPSAVAFACDGTPGWTTDMSDCDDTDDAVNPSAAEVCNEVDDDCDGTVDPADADGASTWYSDDDGDNYGAGAGTTACDAPVGTVSNASDCDDAASSVYPGATEVCDDVDQDCNGSVDDNATDIGTWYMDADSDSFGDASMSTTACDAPAGYVATSSDCDDADDGAYPGATESCDGADNDCDGSTDEAGAVGESTWYMDADSDGYGGPTSTDACDAPLGYVDNTDDCDDADASANPGESEVADGVDNNCDGTVDEGLIAIGDVILTEIDRQPRVGSSATNTNAAWFEVYNTTAADIDLSDWYITRYSSSLGRDGFYVDPADGVIVPAGGYAVFCKTDNFAAVSTSASDLVCDYYWGNETAGASYSSTYEDNTFNMQRDEDTLSIYYGGDASTGTLIDEVHWTYDATSGYWPRDATRSMQLDPSAYDYGSNDDVDNWCSTTNNIYFEWYYVSASNREYGTPGITNHSCP